MITILTRIWSLIVFIFLIRRIHLRRLFMIWKERMNFTWSTSFSTLPPQRKRWRRRWKILKNNELLDTGRVRKWRSKNIRYKSYHTGCRVYNIRLELNVKWMIGWMKVIWNLLILVVIQRGAMPIQVWLDNEWNRDNFWITERVGLFVPSMLWCDINMIWYTR